MGLLFAFGLAALSGWAAYATIRTLARRRVGPRWWLALAILLAVGTAVGLWCGFSCEYQVSGHMRVCSFPVPAAFLRWENGPNGWVDYIVPAPLLIAICNVVSVTFAWVLPLSAMCLVREKNS
jgi:hypothetical protein